MKVGDIIVYINEDGSQFYTLNKYYRIYKIDDNFIPGIRCCWIRDDSQVSVYFREDDYDKNWINLTVLRKEKLKRLCFLKD